MPGARQLDQGQEPGIACDGASWGRVVVTAHPAGIGQRRQVFFMEVLGGTALLLAWAAVLLWSATKIVVSAWRADLEHRSLATGLVVGAALAAGIPETVEKCRTTMPSGHNRQWKARLAPQP